MADVLSAAVDEVCKYEAEGEGADMLRKAVQQTFAETPGTSAVSRRCTWACGCRWCSS